MKTKNLVLMLSLLPAFMANYGLVANNQYASKSEAQMARNFFDYFYDVTSSEAFLELDSIFTQIVPLFQQLKEAEYLCRHNNTYTQSTELKRTSDNYELIDQELRKAMSKVCTQYRVSEDTILHILLVYRSTRTA